MMWYLCQMKIKPYGKITTFSSKEKSRDLRIAPYYSKKIRSPESQFFCLRHCFLYPGAVCIMKSPYGAVRNYRLTVMTWFPLPIELQTY